MSDFMERFVVEVAAYLPGWGLDEEYSRGSVTYKRLVHPEIAGAAIYFSFDRNRAEVHGGYPWGFEPYREERVAISVSLDRAPAAVARDIERRFLGKYLARFRTAQEMAYRTALREAQARDVADELAAILGTTAQHSQGGSSSVWCAHGSFSVSSGSEGVYITMERIYGLTPELAKRLAQVFAEG